VSLFFWIKWGWVPWFGKYLGYFWFYLASTGPQPLGTNGAE
jgi:hypothetical protein